MSQEAKESITSLQNNDFVTEDDDLYGDLSDTKVAVATVSNNTKKRKITPPPLQPPLNDGAADDGVASSSSASMAHLPSSRTNNSKTLSITDELEQAKLKISKLENENQILKRNIGTLYRTATNEIKRKDDQISRLRTELHETASSSTTK